MTRQEFTQRTNVEVSYNEFEAINEVYMNSEVDKDEFCKIWCKINASRVKKAIEAKRAAEKQEVIKDKVADVYYNIRYICWEDSVKEAETYLTLRQRKALQLAGIEVDGKRVSHIIYECAKYLAVA